ncbi:MAG: tol-pal system-associated acyl-CoA thioesterase [Pseudomonadales bacterium]
MHEPFRLPIRIYMEDTDTGGIVYYVNYLKFIERARTEFMRSLGFGKQFIFEQDIMFVVHSLSVDYKQPARLDDELVATAQLLKLGRAGMQLNQQVWRAQDLLVDSQVKLACVNKKSLRPAAMPADIIAVLKTL